MKLREYQQDIIDDVEASLAFDDTCIITASMGAGKSVIIAKLAQDFALAGKTVVVLTNLTALIPQLAKHLDEFNLNYNVVKAGSHKIEPDVKIWLIMEQSFHDDKRNELNIDCDVLLKDEYHIGVGQNRFESIRRHLNPKSIIGLTGTPFDEAGYLMHGVNEENLITHGSAKDLTDLGYLVPLKYYIPKWAEIKDYSSVSKSGNDYSGVGLDQIINTSEHNDMIISSMNQMNAKDKKTLVYASSIEHADSIYQALLKDGYNVGVVHSKLDSKNNEKIIAKFKDEYVGESNLIDSDDSVIDTLVSVSSLTIGFDAPKASLLVLCRPTKVLRLYLQIIGRTARLYPGKEYGEVLDLAQCVSTHGFMTEPRAYIKRGDREKLIKEKERTSTLIMEHIVKDMPTEISRDIIDAKIKEIKQEEANIDNLSLDKLDALFSTTMDLEVAISIAYRINQRIRGIYYKDNTPKWTIEPALTMINEYPEYKLRLIRTYKTRMKNIVKDNKKLGAIHYFDQFLREQPPYSFGKDDFQRE